MHNGQMIKQMPHLTWSDRRWVTEEEVTAMTAYNILYAIDNRAIYPMLHKWDRFLSLYQEVQMQEGWPWGFLWYPMGNGWDLIMLIIQLEAKSALQIFTYDGERKVETEKCVSWQVKLCITLKNLKEYVYQGLDPQIKVKHLLNEIRWEKLSNPIVALNLKETIDKYEMCIDVVSVFFS